MENKIYEPLPEDLSLPATKADLKNFVTKDDLKTTLQNFVTKDKLKAELESSPPRRNSKRK